MKNLILISLDTVRADVGYSGQFSGIESLRKDSVTFLNTISSSPLTPVSHATVFTGQQPFNHGVRHLFKEKLNPEQKTICSIFKENGYLTKAIVSCPGMNAWYGFDKGFDDYDDEIPKLADGSDPLLTVDVKLRGTALKRADIVVSKAKDWITKNKSEKFLLFIHFFDAHWPYEAPVKYGGNNAYESEVAYADHHLNDFLNFIKKEGVYENSDIVCFSDHGEDLEGLYPNDKGGQKLGHPEEFGHGCLLYDQTQKVLLIVHSSDLPSNININRQARLVDIMPTVLEMFHFDGFTKEKPDGRSLIPIIKGIESSPGVAYAETFYPEEQTMATHGMHSSARNKMAFFVDGRFKIIRHLESDYIEIFDSLKDPDELNNLYSTNNSK